MSSSTAPDIAAMTHIRPAEIKTYHKKTYDRIDPAKTFDGKGKTVLITAGATGIGLSIATSFAKSGVARLILIQRRQEVLDSAKHSIEAAYPSTKVTTHAASVTDLERMTSILKQSGQIDILVPNAGVSHPFVQSKDVTTEDFRRTFEVNVVSTFHLIREFVALPSTSPRSVILTSSAAGQMAQPGNIGYGPSKAAANQMMQRFAIENQGVGVTFQVFHPGMVRTESAVELVPEEALNWEDVSLPGDFAVWLASEEAKFLEGRFVWAQWDVDELLGMKGRVEANPMLLTTTTVV